MAGASEILRQLGAALRDLREETGMSGRRLAAELKWSQAKISRIETGIIRPTVEDVDAFLTKVKAPSADRKRIHALAERAQTIRTGWKTSHRFGPARQRELDELLRISERVVVYGPIHVPTLLQTPEYARSVLELSTGSGNDVDTSVAAGFSRQRSLFDPDGPRYDFLLTEAALRFRPGPSWPLLRAQLDRLGSVAALERVRMRIVPWAEAQTALVNHGFAAYYPPDDIRPPEVRIDSVSAELQVTGDEAGTAYQQAFDQLARAALPEGETKRFISDVAKSLPED